VEWKLTRANHVALTVDPPSRRVRYWSLEARGDERIRDRLHDLGHPGDVEVDAAVGGAVGPPEHVHIADRCRLVCLQEGAGRVGGVVLVGVARPDVLVEDAAVAEAPEPLDREPCVQRLQILLGQATGAQRIIWLAGVAGASIVSVGLSVLLLGLWRFNRLVRRDVEAHLAQAVSTREEALVTEEMLGLTQTFEQFPDPRAGYLGLTSACLTRSCWCLAAI